MPDKSFLHVPGSYPPLAVAGSVALALMKAGKAATWEDLVWLRQSHPDGLEPADRKRRAALGKIALTPEMRRRLDEFGTELTMLQNNVPKSGRSTVTFVVCPECLRFAMAASDGPKSCSLTWGCAGSPVRAKAAPLSEVPSEDYVKAGMVDDDGVLKDSADVSVEASVEAAVSDSPVDVEPPAGGESQAASAASEFDDLPLEEPPDDEWPDVEPPLVLDAPDDVGDWGFDGPGLPVPGDEVDGDDLFDAPPSPPDRAPSRQASPPAEVVLFDDDDLFGA